MDEITKAWRAVYESPEGQKAIAFLLRDLGLYDELAPGNSFHAGIMMGQRNVAARIARLVGRKPEDFVKDAHKDSDLVSNMLRLGQEELF